MGRLAVFQKPDLILLHPLPHKIMPDTWAMFILTLLNPQIDSDLASSHGSSRGSSPFLPPAMPLLQVKSVPVLEPYNEAAIDCPPELLAASSQAGSGRASPSKCQAC